MNNTAEVKENYEPVRDSVRTERERLVATVTELQKRLAATERRSELGFDPAFARVESTIKRQLTAAHEAIALFDTKQQGLHAARTGSAAKAARAAAQDAAQLFEGKLAGFASAALLLKERAATLADALQMRDPNLWPSIQSVDTAARGRVIEVLGLVGIKLEGFGSFSAKPSESLIKRFELKQGK